MQRCFVIQPFDDGGPYDKRYDDVLCPAIKDAALEPYRVDQDPTTTIPIDAIEENIRTSEICLADITPDNPNIWYEVGFAVANDKPVVMICAKPRPTKTPFDVQHRHIIYYTPDSPSDFKKLQREVTERLKAQIEKVAAMQTDSDLTSYEIAVMDSIVENRYYEPQGATLDDIQNNVRKAGHTDIATTLGLESLKRKGLIEYEYGENGNLAYGVYVLTESGMHWYMANRDSYPPPPSGI